MVGNTMFFAGTDPVTNLRELYKADGLTGAASLVHRFGGSFGGMPTELTAWNGNLYFSAIDSALGGEPFRSDGTDAGTWLLKDISAGAGYSSPEHFTAAGHCSAIDLPFGTRGCARGEKQSEQG